MGEKQTQAGSVHQERTGQKTRRSRAFRPHTLPRKPTIFLTAPLAHAARAIHLGPCETLRRYRELATSSKTQGLTTKSDGVWLALLGADWVSPEAARGQPT